MTIPDLDILDRYVLTMSCGHKRRCMSPQYVGRELPCVDTNCIASNVTVASIWDTRLNQNVDSIRWLNPKAAIHGAYAEASTKKEKKFWGKILAGTLGIRL